MLTSAGALAARGSLDEFHSTPTFTVVDVETTGLDPFQSRIVECAMVKCASDGNVVDEWTSLIAPADNAEIGASWLHGITRASLEGAPFFADVALEIAARLRGTIVVGHVVAFDLAHLRAEFGRIGLSLPDLSGAATCTHELASAYLPPGSRTLAAVCARLGIARNNAHTALGDARATVSVLAAFLRRGVDLGWDAMLGRARATSWPNYLMNEPFVSRALARPVGRSATIYYADF